MNFSEYVNNDAYEYAINLLSDIVEGHMKGVCASSETDKDVIDYLTSECAWALVNEMVDGVITPLQFERTTNELGKILWSINPENPKRK